MRDRKERMKSERVRKKENIASIVSLTHTLRSRKEEEERKKERKTNIAPSSTLTARSTSTVKSICPGVSITGRKRKRRRRKERE